MINVTYNNWNRWYDEILDDFGFNIEDDIKSAKILNDKIVEKGKFDIHNLHLTNQCIVFGAGPSIKKHIHLIKKNVDLKKYILIAADGATTALLEEGLLPSIIVTDLDGNMDNIIDANKKGSILYVHAHGDNIDKIEKYVPQLNNIIPTTQAEPENLLENYGGFTDGDRAVHIAVYALYMKKIILAGMDFGNIITNYSRPEIKVNLQEADSFKKLKLDYAQKLLNALKKENSQLSIIDLMNWS